MDISEDGYWKPQASNTSILSLPNISKLLQHAKRIRQLNYHVLPQTKLIYDIQIIVTLYLFNSLLYDCHMDYWQRLFLWNIICDI
jgi:hypothetical protein